MELSLHSAGCASFATKYVFCWLNNRLDTFETFFDARIDLWERRLKKQSRLMMDNARNSLKKRGIDKNIDKELARFKEKASIDPHVKRLSVDVIGRLSMTGGQPHAGLEQGMAFDKGC